MHTYMHTYICTHTQAAHLTSPHLISPLLNSPHLTSPHLSSLHLTSRHLTYSFTDSLAHSLAPTLSHRLLVSISCISLSIHATVGRSRLDKAFAFQRLENTSFDPRFDRAAEIANCEGYPQRCDARDEAQLAVKGLVNHLAVMGWWRWSRIHTVIHTCIYTYIHTYIYTYIHTYIWGRTVAQDRGDTRFIRPSRSGASWS